MLPHIPGEIRFQFVQDLILRGAGIQIGIDDILAVLFGETLVDLPEEPVDIIFGISRLIYLRRQAIAHYPAAEKLNSDLLQRQIGVNSI